MDREHSQASFHQVAANVLRTVIDGKRRLSARLLESAQYLRPGIWLLSEPRIAHHALSPGQPASVRDTKNLSSSGAGVLKRIVYRFLFWITPPYVVRVGIDGGAGEIDGQVSGFPVLVMGRNGGAILIDRARGEVFRLGAARCASTEGSEIRRRLARYVVLPALEIIDEGKAERESFVQGESFVTRRSDERISAAGILLRQFEELSMKERKPPSMVLWERVIDYAKTLPLPESASRRANVTPDGVFSQLPFTPAHGDMSGFNILVQNGKPRLIDLADCAWLPALFDFYFLNHQEMLAGRPDLWHHFIVGDGWKVIETALKKCGVGRIDRHEWLVALFFMECYMWGLKEGASALDRSALRRWWLPVGEVLTYLQNT